MLRPGFSHLAPSALLMLVITCPPVPVYSAADANENADALERALELDEGKSAPRDIEGAAALYRVAAENGDAFAHLRLGYLAETGDGVPQDYNVARKHYQAAADAGLAEARVRLAICHLEGWGGPADRAAFAREIRLAAEAGDASAQSILATMLAIGFAVPENRAEAVTWLERAAASDDALAQYSLGRYAEKARRRAVMPNLDLPRTWYQLSAEQEYRAGMIAMARTFLGRSRGNRNWELGQQWLRLAADSGDAEAPYILAVCELLHVDRPKTDPSQAREWLKLASERGNARATEVLQLEIAGRELASAMRYVLNVPFDERYVQRAAKKAGNEPTRIPVIYRVVRPIYPQALRFTKTTGKVLVDFVVDTTGRVVNPKAIESSHPLFADRAIEAVRQWRFHPGRRDGHLVKTHMQVPVFFTLDAEQLDGIEGMLNHARARAEALGPEVKADALELLPARPRHRLPKPRMADGSAVPEDGRAMVLLVLDPAGWPLRGHILEAEPKALGPALLEVGLTNEFKPREVNGEALPSNVVLAYRAKPGEPVLRKP